jgi:hypothetical protein
MAFPQRHQWTEEEYLAFERNHPQRHEFVGGEGLILGFGKPTLEICTLGKTNRMVYRVSRAF